MSFVICVLFLTISRRLCAGRHKVTFDVVCTARPPKWLEESSAASAPSAGPQEPPAPDTGRPALYQVTLEKNPRLWDGADLARYLSNTECAHLVPGLLKQVGVATARAGSWPGPTARTCGLLRHTATRVAQRW